VLAEAGPKGRPDRSSSTWAGVTLRVSTTRRPSSPTPSATARTVVYTANGQPAPSLLLATVEAFQVLLKSDAAADAMNHDGVRADTVRVLEER
jgi:hypothetical protein